MTYDQKVDRWLIRFAVALLLFCVFFWFVIVLPDIAERKAAEAYCEASGGKYVSIRREVGCWKIEEVR